MYFIVFCILAIWPWQILTPPCSNFYYAAKSSVVDCILTSSRFIFKYLRAIHSSFVSIAKAETSRIHDCLFGNILTTRVRRLISWLYRSSMFVERIFLRWVSGKAYTPSISSPYVSRNSATFGCDVSNASTVSRILSLADSRLLDPVISLRYATIFFRSFWETMLNTLRTKWVWHRCHTTPWNWRFAALTNPLWSSETMYSTPFSPRSLSSLNTWDQLCSFSESAFQTPRCSRYPSSAYTDNKQYPLARNM